MPFRADKRLLLAANAGRLAFLTPAVLPVPAVGGDPEARRLRCKSSHQRKQGSPRKRPVSSIGTASRCLSFFRLFPDDSTAEAWFVQQRWPSGIACPACGSTNVQERASRKPQPYRCRDCRKDFSAKAGTIMQGSPLGFQTWVLAFYLLTTNIKGTSSMKLHRDLGVTQKTAWFLAHRIREAFVDEFEPVRAPA